MFKRPVRDLLTGAVFPLLTIKLILDDVVEDFQQIEGQVVVLGQGEEEPGCGEGLQ